MRDQIILADHNIKHFIMTDSAQNNSQYTKLAKQIKQQGLALGFQQVQITHADPGKHAAHLQQWIEQDYHGDMHYMQNNLELRESPHKLQNDAIRVISLRYDYLTQAHDAQSLLEQDDHAYVSRYALGRDYHKLLRKKLSSLCALISANSEFKQHRAFVDSAPILERAFAQQAGLGWIGKNTMLINSRAGSWFFLGEILTDAPLPIDAPQQTGHCGSCTRCLEICPTDAFVSPWQLDARRCISYLTIENKNSIPLEFRKAMGNRVFGCDDCQLVCPWNKFAQFSLEKDFKARHQLDHIKLVTLFNWSEQEFLDNTAGSAIRRIGYVNWLRNLSVALGNAAYSPEIVSALNNKVCDKQMLKEHLQWALSEQHLKKENIIQISSL